MRFREFNQDKDLESALVNTLLNMQGDADEKDQSSEISFDAVQSLMTNTGFPAFNYDVFKKLNAVIEYSVAVLVVPLNNCSVAMII